MILRKTPLKVYSNLNSKAKKKAKRVEVVTQPCLTSLMTPNSAYISP